MMHKRLDEDAILVGTDPVSLTEDCRLIRETHRTDLPCADDVIAFLDGYNSFINHTSRPFLPIREQNMLL